MVFFFDEEEFSRLASEVGSTTGSFFFCTKVLLRFFRTGVGRDDSSVERVNGSSNMALGSLFSMAVVAVLDLV